MKLLLDRHVMGFRNINSQLGHLSFNIQTTTNIFIYLYHYKFIQKSVQTWTSIFFNSLTFLQILILSLKFTKDVLCCWITNFQLLVCLSLYAFMVQWLVCLAMNSQGWVQILAWGVCAQLTQLLIPRADNKCVLGKTWGKWTEETWVLYWAGVLG